MDHGDISRVPVGGFNNVSSPSFQGESKLTIVSVDGWVPATRLQHTSAMLHMVMALKIPQVIGVPIWTHWNAKENWSL